jgi:putative pantetheine hydrolase
VNAYGSITDVPGLAVGHAHRGGDGWLTGVTVVLPPAGTVGAVDVRGGGPGTHETDALAPGTLVDHVDAVVLTGGSAYGLVAAHGVQAWCEEQGRGFVAGQGRVVPIVPAAALFDLGRGGDWANRPDAALGRQAVAACSPQVATGVVGAGTGAVLARGLLKGGIGTASLRLPGGVVVGALVAANAAGSPCASDGTLYAAPFVDDASLRPRVPRADDVGLAGYEAGATPPVSTTLAVVATNARLDVAATRRAASSGHDGLARALRPVHTLFDGDTVFALSTQEVDAAGAADAVPGWPGARGTAGVAAVQAAAADAVMLAVLDAVLSARGVRTPALDVPGYLQAWPPGGIDRTDPG